MAQTAYELLFNQIGILTAQAAIAQFRFAKPATVADQFTLAGVGDLIVGVEQDGQATIGGTLNIATAGISKITVGGTFSAGDPLTADSTGRAIKATGSQPIGGYALQAGVNANEIVSMLVCPLRFGEVLETTVIGAAAGYKIARGVHTQVAASDTVATGLATVVAVVACFQTGPTVKQLFVSASVGDQAGTPAAGSILIITKKPTAVNDVTPVAATDFTDNLVIGWVAVGT